MGKHIIIEKCNSKVELKWRHNKYNHIEFPHKTALVEVSLLLTFSGTVKQ